jgi:hypothetical protein
MLGLEKRRPMGGLGGVASSLYVVVPTILNPDKNASDVASRSSKEAQVRYFGLRPVDHLPGHFGLWLGLVGPWVYMPLMGAFGFAFGKLEKWTLKTATAARIIVFLLLSVGALFYERGIPSLLIFLRYALVLGPAAFWAQRALNRGSMQRD